MKYIKIFILIFTIFSCNTFSDIHQRLIRINEKINIALRFTLYIRTTEVIPDEIYIQNLRTFEIYKLIGSEDKYFYIDDIPAGQYRMGFFIASYNVNRIQFKIFSYSNIIYNLNKSGNYFLGNFFYQYAVNSDKISPTKIEVKEIKNTLKNFYNYVYLNSIKSMPIEKTHIYRLYGYGNVYSINEENNKIQMDILDAIDKEKVIIKSYCEVIDREFNKHHLNSNVLDLIIGYYLISDNINLLIKKGLLYYNIGEIDEALKIFEELKEKDPNIPEYYSILGEIEFKNGNFDKAKYFLYRAISNKTLIVKSYDLYSKILMMENDYKNAKIFSDYSLQIEPNNIEYINTNLEIHKKLDDKKIIKKLEKKQQDLINGR